MRVLIVHNRYRAEGGEERAVGDLAGLLAGAGHSVELLERSSMGVGRGRGMRADVVHAHNLHPLFGWRALAAARDTGARTVLHLHNFRLSCAIGIAYRDGHDCFECRGANTLPGVAHRCRGGTGEAVSYGAGLALQRRSLIRHADALIAVSEAHHKRLLELEVPSSKLTVLPNFVRALNFAQDSRADQGRYALIAGRLVEEKGFDTAIAAARVAGVPLLVAGAGPDEPRLRSLAAGADVRFAGWLSATDLAGARSQAAVMLVPSRWQEVSGYSLLDAMAAGVPVLVSDAGALPELAGAGAGLGPRDVQAWAAALAELWSNPGLRREQGRRALARARDQFGEQRYLERLLAIYRAPGSG
jgi:glycosyltransferase involved in cell wall biosynthesis